MVHVNGYRAGKPVVRTGPRLDFSNDGSRNGIQDKQHRFAIGAVITVSDDHDPGIGRTARSHHSRLAVRISHIVDMLLCAVIIRKFP